VREGGRREGGREGRKEGRGGADTELKTKTPHVNVGKKNRGLGTFAPIEPSLPSRETPLGKRREVQERLVWPSIWTYLISIRFFVILYRKNIG